MTIAADLSPVRGAGEFPDMTKPAKGDASTPSEVRIRFDNFDSRSGSIELRDADGVVLSAHSISSVVSSVPCLMPEARVLTERGEVAAQYLCPGVRVVTRDNGLQTVQHVFERHYDWRALGLNPLLRPVKLSVGALGNGRPEGEILLTPSQLLTVTLPGATRAGEWLVRAIDLIGQEGVTSEPLREVRYIQPVFAERQHLMVDGFWTECPPQSRADVLVSGVKDRPVPV